MVRGARILLGALFVIFGLNGFFNFIPVPPPPERAWAFLHALISTGYLMKLVKTIEVICGALLLLNFYLPMATVVLAPIVVNICLYHAFLDKKGAPIAIVIGVLYGLVVFGYREYFSGLFTMRARIRG